MERKRRDLMKFLRRKGITPAKASKLLVSSLSEEDKYFIYRLKDRSRRSSILSEIRHSCGLETNNDESKNFRKNNEIQKTSTNGESSYRLGAYTEYLMKMISSDSDSDIDEIVGKFKKIKTSTRKRAICDVADREAKVANNEADYENLSPKLSTQSVKGLILNVKNCGELSDENDVSVIEIFSSDDDKENVKAEQGSQNVIEERNSITGTLNLTDKRNQKKYGTSPLMISKKFNN